MTDNQAPSLPPVEAQSLRDSVAILLNRLILAAHSRGYQDGREEIAPEDRVTGEYVDRLEQEILDKITAIPSPQTWQRLWILTEFSGGGIRDLYHSQSDAEAAIVNIRREHPDLTRSDFVIQVHRVASPRGGPAKE